MDALRENPIPTLLVVIAALAGAAVLIIAAVRGQSDAGGLTFDGYFKTLIYGGVALGVVRVGAQHVENQRAARNGGRTHAKAQSKV